jgi:hypothetical protein
MSRHKSAGQNYCIEIAKETLEIVALGTVVTNQYPIHEEIKSKLNSANACYCAALLLKNAKNKMYKIIILPFVLCGCETSLSH